MPKLIDISPRVHPGTAVWPGDVPFQRDVALDMENGANLTLSSVTTTLHIGAHADGPNHYVRDGVGIGERSLDLYYGPCQVMDARVDRGGRIQPQDLVGEVVSPRVLIRTGTFPDPDEFNEDFAALSPALVAHLARAGVRLIGIDTPSVDPCADKLLESHHAIAERDMAILEGLILEHVEPGNYTLIALPLRLEGCDASPVRAALLPDGQTP